jgi:hypothetical protein
MAFYKRPLRQICYLGLISDDALLKKRCEEHSYFVPITKAHMYGLLDYHCDSRRPVHEELCQTLGGIIRPTNSTAGRVLLNLLDRPLWRFLESKGGEEETNLLKESTAASCRINCYAT